MYKRPYSLIRFLIPFVSTCLITISIAAISATAQLPLDREQIFSFPNTTIGTQEVVTMTPVKLDGRMLFGIASMIPSGEQNISFLDNRAEFIEDSLYKLLEKGFEPTSLRVEVRNKQEYAKIIASDNQNLKDVPLFALTPLDARVAGFTLEESANYVAEVTQKALQKAWQERQPDYLQKQAKLAGILIAIAIALSTITWLLQRQFKKREIALRKQKKSCDDRMKTNIVAMGTEEEITSSSGYCHKLATEQLHNRLMIGSHSFKSYLLQIIQGTIWLGTIAFILGRFPITRAWQGTLLELPLLFSIFLIAIAIAKYSDVFVDKTLEEWLQHRQTLAPQELERWLLRANSFAPIVKSAISCLVITTAALFILSRLGIPLAPILAGAGILSLAISLGSQRLIADLINGTLILVEDQYAIGDFVILNGNAFGRVERLNLRFTSVRNKQGNLITLSNSDVTQVNNLSKDWARVKLYIPVHSSGNVDLTIDTIQKVIDEMAADDFWHGLIQEAEIRGVEDIDGYGFTIGVRFQTKPGDFRKVIRECRRRIKPAFDRANIQFAKRPIYQSVQNDRLHSS